jgi:hypothetical protein
MVMRASQWFLGGATAVTIASAIAAGCGGSTNSNPPQDSGVADATGDVAHEAAPAEAAAETGPDAPPEAACVPDADITKLNPPDAALNDSGATDLGCYTCIKTNCGTQLSACNADCACNTAVEGFLACVGAGGSPISCGSGLISSGNAATIALGGCLAGPLAGGSGPGCLKECGVNIPEGGPPGDGGGDAGDTGSPTDASGQ